MYKRMTWLSRYYDAMLFCFIVYFTSKLVLGDIFDVKILTPIFLKRCFLFLAFSYITFPVAVYLIKMIKLNIAVYKLRKYVAKSEKIVCEAPMFTGMVEGACYVFLTETKLLVYPIVKRYKGDCIEAECPEIIIRLSAIRHFSAEKGSFTLKLPYEDIKFVGKKIDLFARELKKLLQKKDET